MSSRRPSGSGRVFRLLLAVALVPVMGFQPAVSAVAAPPNSMVISGDAPFTRTEMVTIESDVASATTMSLSNDGSSWSTTETYSPTRGAWGLDSSSDGTKTVWVRYFDESDILVEELSDTIVLDRIAPDGTLTISGPGAPGFTTTSTVTLNSAISGEPVFMSFSNDGETWSNTEAFATTKSWTLSADDGLKTVFARYWDGAGNEHTTAAQITLDTTGPGGTFEIVGTPPVPGYTGSVAVTLSSYGITGDPMFMSFSNDGVIWSNAELFSVTKSWALSSGDGLKTVFARYYDALGNMHLAGAQITLDTTAPSGSMSVNAGAIFATTGSVTVDSEVTGATHMRFSNDGATWSQWETYTGAKAWTLSSSDGVKTVYAQYHDAVGNTVPLSDTITLDTTAPNGTVSIKNGASWVNTDTVPVISSVTGATEMQFRNEDGEWSGWRSYDTTATWTLEAAEGTRTVSAMYRDPAGNTLVRSDTIKMDTIAPDAPTGLAYSKLSPTSMTLTWNEADDHGGSKAWFYTIYSVVNGQDVMIDGAQIVMGTSKEFKMAPGSTYMFRIDATDQVGNKSPKSTAFTVTTPAYGWGSTLVAGFGTPSTTPTSLTTGYHQQVTMTGVLTLKNGYYGLKPSERRVYVSRWDGSKWVTVGRAAPVAGSPTMPTSAPVKYALAFAAPDNKSAYVMWFAGDGYNAYAQSAAQWINPRVYLTIKAPTKAYRSTSFYVSGSMLPAHAVGAKIVRVYAQKYVYSRGKWRWVATTIGGASYGRAAMISSTAWRLKVRLGRGKYRFQAYVAQDAQHATTRSAYSSICTVR